MNPVTVYEVVGACVTVIIGAITYLRSSPDRRQVNSAFVSILGVICVMLMSVRYDVLPKMTERCRLAEEVAAYPRLEKLMKKSVDAMKITEESPEPLMKYVFGLRLDALEHHTDAAGQGRFLVDQSEMPSFALEMIRSTLKSIIATSYVQFREWWDTPWGKKYEEANEGAVKRGVSITRIFIFSNRDDFAAAREHLAHQTAAGIDVRYVYVGDLNVQMTSDMIVVDSDRLAGELRLTAEKGMKEAEFCTRAVDVSDVSNRIQRVIVQAETYRVGS